MKILIMDSGKEEPGLFLTVNCLPVPKNGETVDRILEILVYHGANPNILIDAHPHIGTDKLPQVIVNMRKTIEKYGGEVHFNSRVRDIVIEQNRVKGDYRGGTGNSCRARYSCHGTFGP